MYGDFALRVSRSCFIQRESAQEGGQYCCPFSMQYFYEKYIGETGWYV